MVGATICQEAIGTCDFEYNEKIVRLIVWDTAGFERNFDMIPNRWVTCNYNNYTFVHNTMVAVYYPVL